MKKNLKVIGYGLLVIGMLLVSMHTMAQQHEWQSTSVMQGSNSAYSPQVTAVGAMSVSEMATTTTETYSPAQVPGQAPANGPHKVRPVVPGPLGDALIPLLIMALGFVGYIAIKRRKRNIDI